MSAEVTDLAVEKRRILLERIGRNDARLNISGSIFSWRGFGFSPDSARWVRYCCEDCGTEFKETPAEMPDILSAHAYACNKREIQEA